MDPTQPNKPSASQSTDPPRSTTLVPAATLQLYGASLPAFSSLYSTFASLSNRVTQWYWPWKVESLSPEDKARREIVERLKSLDRDIENAEKEMEEAQAAYENAKNATDQCELFAAEKNRLANERLLQAIHVLMKLKQMDFIHSTQTLEPAPESEGLAGFDQSVNLLKTQLTPLLSIPESPDGISIQLEKIDRVLKDLQPLVNSLWIFRMALINKLFLEASSKGEPRGSTDGIDRAYLLRETIAKRVNEDISVLTMTLQALCVSSGNDEKAAPSGHPLSDLEFMCSKDRLLNAYERSANAANMSRDDWKGKIKEEAKCLRTVETLGCTLRVLKAQKDVIMQSIAPSSTPPPPSLMLDKPDTEEDEACLDDTALIPTPVLPLPDALALPRASSSLPPDNTNVSPEMIIWYLRMRGTPGAQQ